jgi:putative tricarboxylic transport membrane protein
VRTSDFYSGLTTLLTGLGVVIVAARIPDPGHDVIGPGAFPMVLGVVLAVCGVAILLASLPACRAPEAQRSRWPVLIAILALLIVYAVTLDSVGFVPGTAAFVIGSLLLLGVRKPFELASASVGISISVYIIFSLLLDVKLPTGHLLGL